MSQKLYDDLRNLQRSAIFIEESEDSICATGTIGCNWLTGESDLTARAAGCNIRINYYHGNNGPYHSHVMVIADRNTEEQHQKRIILAYGQDRSLPLAGYLFYYLMSEASDCRKSLLQGVHDYPLNQGSNSGPLGARVDCLHIDHDATT
ncbi:hypothetical protein ElyMa_005037000 [Elysia marginata]|uniref:Helitron helicase-like domain-containing protein n=1 Tax=Elysia marginata TaxID=1093978 RepID=A0AAV4JDU3_9GAST|nr:hypothetical protein ElyMa_005037000 [Elysia marginata]